MYLFMMLALVGNASINLRSGGAGLTVSNAGDLNGDTPLELNGEDVVDDVGDGLLKLFFLFI